MEARRREEDEEADEEEEEEDDEWFKVAVGVEEQGEGGEKTRNGMTAGVDGSAVEAPTSTKSEEDSVGGEKYVVVGGDGITRPRPIPPPPS